MLDDLIDSLQDAVERTFSVEFFFATLFVLLLISLYFGLDLPGAQTVRRWVGIQPRNPTGGGGGGGSA